MEARLFEAGASAPSQRIAFSYDAADRLTGWDDGSQRGSYAYDAAGRLLEERVTIGTVTLAHRYEYEPDGKKASYTGPDGTTVRYRYDAAGRLAAVELPTGTLAVGDYRWSVPQTLLLPGGGRREIDYNGRLRPVAIRGRDPGGNLLFEEHYQYGQREELTERSDGALTERYRYDELRRLTEAQRAAGTARWQLDPVGNRLADAGGPWRYNADNQLLDRPGAHYDYDANGRRVRQGVNGRVLIYRYDANHRLTRVEDEAGTEVARYGYDPFDRRLWKEVDGQRTLYHYADEGLVGEYRADGSLLREYGYPPDGLWSSGSWYQRTPAATAYVHADQLGVIRRLVLANGEVVWAGRYDPFGSAEADPASTWTQPWRLPGQYEDPESGLFLNGRRYYDPATGSYLTEDPLGLAGGWNLYGYVDHDPLNSADPTGECLVAGLAMTAAEMAFDAARGCMGSAQSYAVSALMNSSCGIGKAVQLGWAFGKRLMGPLWSLAKRYGERGFDALQNAYRRAHCGAFNSFPAGTLVDTAEGRRPIETLQVGERVRSFAEWEKKESFQPVEAVIEGEREYDLYRLTLADGETLEATDNHPLYVLGRGWVEAKALHPGDRLYRQERGTLRLRAVEHQRRHEHVYNLTVANTHTFFVGGEGVLVHNGCGGDFTKQQERSIRSLEKQIEKHKQKLEEFKENPTVRPGMENLPDDLIKAQQQKRIEHLEKEIKTFEENIDKVKNGEL